MQSHSAWSAWIEIENESWNLVDGQSSHSAWSVGIEIPTDITFPLCGIVALRMECVD